MHLAWYGRKLSAQKKAPYKRSDILKIKANFTKSSATF